MSVIINTADPTGLDVWARGMRPLACWKYGFQSHRLYACLSVVSVSCCAGLCDSSFTLLEWSYWKYGPYNDIKQLCGFGENVFMWGINARPYRYCTTLIVCVGIGGRCIKTKTGSNWWGNICGCSNPGWNTGILYDTDEQQTRWFVSSKYYEPNKISVLTTLF